MLLIVGGGFGNRSDAVGNTGLEEGIGCEHGPEWLLEERYEGGLEATERKWKVGRMGKLDWMDGILEGRRKGEGVDPTSS